MARNVVFFFIAFLIAAIIGFWPTYSARIASGATGWVHVHGALMLAWCLLLIAQAWLIRDRRGPLHRQLGKVSFVLVPLIVISALAVEHESLARAAGKYDLETLFFAYLIVALLFIFLLAYGLAIFHRRNRALHMRYMICTLLTMIDPVFARIFDVRLGIGYPIGQVMTFAMVDATLLWLCIADRHTPHRAFHQILAAFLLVQIPTFFVYKTAWWPGVVTWFAGVPIS